MSTSAPVAEQREPAKSSAASRVTVCTMCEGSHHFGLGALVNSLYANGYRGIIWAGYRGSLPPWASSATSGSWFQEFKVAHGCVIRFVPLDAKVHFTNYKPDFMLRVLEWCDPAIEGVAYFDPDIVVKCRWSFFEEWSECGVALVKDINAGMTSTHPFRAAWRRHAESLGLDQQREIEFYCNAGFIAVRREWTGFLLALQRLISGVPSEVGHMKLKHADPSDPFHTPDQDMLNTALMCTDEPLSIIGPEGMDFIPGGFVMSHAIGGQKPWNKRMLLSALKGVPPRDADKAFWRNVDGPIALYASFVKSVRRLDLALGAAIGRLWRRA